MRRTPRVEVSVIVSTLNRARYLDDCMDSLASQEGEASYEVIVIDNGSTDETPEVLERWCRRDPRFRTAREPRLGLSQGKNAGAARAAGDLLLFTDDDAIADPLWIRSYREFFRRAGDGFGLAGGPIVPVLHDLAELPTWLRPEALEDLGMLMYSGERRLIEPDYVWGANMAIPRSVFEKLGSWDETSGRRGDERGTFEDTEYQDRLRRAGGTVWFCPQAVVRHRVDRSLVTPRRVAETAFARGRNAVWAEGLSAWGDIGSIPRRNLAAGLAALGANVARWTAWALAFRLSGSQAAFERGRRAAWSTGRSLDRLRPGRSTARYRTIARGTFRLRELPLRLAGVPR
jgi:glucosyl-dolichyl phosphate glucuronosyltransferase